MSPNIVCPQVVIAAPDPAVGTTVIDLTGQIQSNTQFAGSVALTKDILPVNHAHSSSSLLPGQESNSGPCLVPSEHPPRSGTLPKKTVSFDTHRDVRVFTPYSTVYQHSDFTQVCSSIKQHKSTLTPIVYIMAQCASIDHSLKEVFYKASFTTPLANPIALEDVNSDFYY